MAENPNCSETSTTNPPTRRTSSLPTLSRIFKSQTSSIQQRSCPTIKAKPAASFKMFLVKALIGGGAIYLTAILGVWGEAEESTQMYKKLKEAISSKIGNENTIPNNLKSDMIDKMNKSKDFLKSHLEGIPKELKVYYDKSEKYINDLIKGKKS